METYQEIKSFVCVYFTLETVYDPISHQGTAKFVLHFYS